MGQSRSFPSFCCKTDDNRNQIHRKHQQFIQKALSSLKRRYNKQPWQRAIISILNEYQYPKHTDTLLRQETEWTFHRFMTKNEDFQNEHYAVGGFSNLRYELNDYDNEKNHLKLLNSDLKKELIQECVLEKNIHYEYEINNSFKQKLRLYHNNTLLNHNIQSSYDHSQLSLEQSQGVFQPIQQYKEVTLIMESHIKQEGNILNACFQFYQFYFPQYYQVTELNIYKRSTIENNISKLSHQSINEEYSRSSVFSSGARSMIKTNKVSQVRWFMNKAADDLKQFTFFFTTVVLNFYQITDLRIAFHGQQFQNLFSFENLINFVLSLLFSVPQIYQPMIELHHQGYQSQNNSIEKFTQRSEGQSITQFDITSKFSLDQNTVKYIKLKFVKLEEQSIDSVGFANIQNKDASFYLDHHQIERVPYAKAIDFLQNIQLVQSPTHKLKVLIECCQLIDQSIKDFYEMFNITSNECKYDADQLISIIIYIIAMAKIPNILSHIKFIQSFALKNTWNSSAGYILTSFEAAFQHIMNQQNLNTESIESSAEKIFG